ncbi:MAG: NfeD family protein [Candidatus Gastranaerophilales bacterium]|nr:NfeD family protein [Candidatus Gastranaerophilales bacterium]
MLELWMIFIIISVIAALVEIFAPTLFSINFAIAGIITAIIAVFWGNFYTLMIIFLALSLISIIFIKPILVRYLKSKTSSADFSSEYIGKIVKSIEPISTTKGAITIYDERWEARIKEGCEEIPTGCDVKIISNDSLVLYVEKV